jgi:hypothetical protein
MARTPKCRCRHCAALKIEVAALRAVVETVLSELARLGAISAEHARVLIEYGDDIAAQ